MNESQMTGATKAYGLAAAVAFLLSAVLVVVKEKSETVFNLMKAVTMHHWFTHAVFTVLVFLVVGYALSKSNGGQGPNIEDRKLSCLVTASFVVACLIPAVFYGLFD
jgi:DMSO/TMAO reductase YedYZ heme-binding membrane subunit